MQDTISVKGAKEHNLRNIDVEIPRNKFVVIAGVSGSGKSSLTFDTVYAEGQHRSLESLSAYSRKFVTQLKKPNADFVTGLSPVISIEQKTTVRNQRSTVGTMTGISDYLRMLFATIGVAHCPYCAYEMPTRSTHQILERMLSLPEGTEVEIRAPVFKYYGEEWTYLLDDVHTRGYRHIVVDGQPHDLSEELVLDEELSYQIDAIVVEHDEETIRAADYIIEMGSGPGVHGGEVIVQGCIDQIMRNPASLTC